MRKPLFLTLCFLGLWACGALHWFASHDEEPLLDHDEVYWIGSTLYYDLAFVQRDFAHEAWGWLPARENPPLAKYVLGAGLAVAGHRITSIESLAYFYLKWLRWEKDPSAQPANAGEEKRAQVVRAAGPDFREQVRNGKRAPLPRPVVRAARNTVLVSAMLGSLLLFLLGVAAKDRVAGLIGSQLILFHPVATTAAGHAMSDTIGLLFALLAALALFRWYQRFAGGPPPTTGTAGATVLAGITLALACATKMNNLVSVLLAGLLVTLTLVQRWRTGARHAARQAAQHGLAMLTIAILGFILINPAILRDFPAALGAVITEHRYTETVQVDLRYAHPDGLTGRLAAIMEMAFFGPQGLVLMLGILAWAALRRGRDLATRFAVCWWLVAFASIAHWLPFAWPRYVLPLLAPSAWLVGLALSALVQPLITRGERRAVATPARSPA